MMIGGIDFAPLYGAFVRRRPQAVVRDEELRLHLTFLALGSALIAVLLGTRPLRRRGGDPPRRLPDDLVMTTTGFASTDYATWLPAVPARRRFLSCSCSSGRPRGRRAARSRSPATSSSVASCDAARPDDSSRVRLAGRLNRISLDERAARRDRLRPHLRRAVVVGSIALLADAHRTELELSPFEALAASASALGYIGPRSASLGRWAPSLPSVTSKTIIIVLMWIGRLEIVPVIVLLTRAYWRA